MISISLALGFLAFAPQDAPARQDAHAELAAKTFATLDRYDPLDTSKLPFVKVTWPGSDRARRGFLLSESNGVATIRFVDLATSRVTTESRPSSQEKPASVERDDITKYAKELVERVNGRGGPDDRYYLHPTETMSPTAEALLLARACARRGLRHEVAELLACLQGLDDALTSVAQGARWQLSIECADPKIPRAALLEHHRRWLEVFTLPDMWRQMVDNHVKILARMVGEDEERAAASRPSSAPSNDDLAAQLIVDLRNQEDPPSYDMFLVNGDYISGHGTQESWNESTAGRLKKLGFSAIPRLIDALEDDTLTRCVWYNSRFGGSFWVVPVSAFANSILGEISGISIGGTPAEVHGKWTTWWKEIQTKGEEAVTAETVARGDDTSSSCAEHFLERWPKRVGDVIAGAKRADNRAVRDLLVSIVGKSDEPQAAAFLREELEKGPYATSRISAAKAMLAKGNQEGLRAIQRAWRSGSAHRGVRDPSVPEAVADFDYAISLGEGSKATIEFLISAGDFDALDCVASSVLMLTPNDRRTVLDAIRYEHIDGILKKAPDVSKPKFESLVEDMLAGMLDDNYRERGWSSHGASYRGKSGQLLNARTSDLAAVALAADWPDRYDFDSTGSVKSRDAGIVDVKNRWRKSRGLPELPPRKPRDLRSNDPEIPRIVAQLVASSSPEEVQKDRTKLESMGLGALPWVEDKIRELPADHPAQKELGALAGDLANYVREVSVVADGWDFPPALASRAKAMKGARLESRVTLQLLLDAFAALPNGLGTVEISADRVGDGTGVAVKIVATPGESRGKNRVESWRSIVADERDLLGSACGWNPGTVTKIEHHWDEMNSIDEALGCERDKWFRIVIGVTAD